MPDNHQTPPEILPPLSPAPVGGLPQFSKAEYGPSAERCKFCGNFISNIYYRIQGNMACASCAQRVQAGLPTDSSSAFAGGLMLGIGAAVVALIVYAGFTIVTHIYLGYLALGVGWFIAKAMMKGSKGLGGRHYQIAAVLLTYAVISVAEIPITLVSIARSPNFHGNIGTVVVRFWPQLLLRGLASPFLDMREPFHGAIGLIILFIGMRIAWQLTAARRVDIDGPYSVTAG